MKFNVFGDAKGQPRPRARAFKMGSKYIAKFYDDDSANDWKIKVNEAIKEHTHDTYEINKNNAYTVIISFYFSRPKSHYKSTKELTSSAPRYMIQKPDIDNLAKLILDCITKSTKVWRDDSQVTTLMLSKAFWDQNIDAANVTIMEESNALVKLTN